MSKGQNRKLIITFGVAVVLSAAIGLAINLMKFNNAKSEAQKVIVNLASGCDKEAEQTLIMAEDCFNAAFLNPLRKKYHVETMTCNVKDTLHVSGMTQEQNALEYFRSRLGERRIDTTHHIYNVSENATIHYVCLVQTGEELLFMEIESRETSPHSAYADITLDQRNNDLYHYDASDISIARYEGSKLVFQSGSFPYPQQISLSANQWSETIHHYFHYALQNSSSNQQWVVTIHRNLWFDTLISASYVFLATIIVLCLAFVAVKLYRKEPFGLRATVFLLIMGLFLFIFIVLGLITVRNLTAVNTEANTGVLKEKTMSINIEISNFISENDTEDALFGYVIRLSKAFFCDINVFDTTGTLLVSSSAGLLEGSNVPKQMNANAYRQLRGLGSKFISPIFVQKESLRRIKFLSSYMPILNADNEVVGFLNVPFISQQWELERKIRGVISNFAGIYLLFANIALLFAAFISTILTNIKKNERDKAWKELAKQVAHEVKNPLTPMKLSLQHLQRLKQSGNEAFDDKFNAVSQSLIEQINTLSEIATEFSDYSRMQDVVLEKVNVVSCLQTAVSMFANTDSIALNFTSHNQTDVPILADKALLIRIFNNLLKNAIQALSNLPNGKVDVDLSTTNRHCIITITDNGCGISEENQAKIFFDSFTTKNDGSGLGLVIVKNTIESFKGSLSVTSKEDKGSCFTITLPLIKD
ncbi:MAG: HAMP domain-containing histidine kinase [Bacteroidales bacterium]|jgi:signal transduction histidine kinase|nr:HAMP domain-containing histidine kinase [Bacteroidales bacterium]